MLMLFAANGSISIDSLKTGSLMFPVFHTVPQVKHGFLGSKVLINGGV